MFRRFGIARSLLGPTLVGCQAPSPPFEELPHPNLGRRLPDLPSFPISEISKHKSRESVWVTYQEGVYDVTEFVAKHPGGVEKILLGAGTAVDPFWRLYGQHVHLAHVGHMLEGMRVGNVDEKEYKEQREAAEGDATDPYRVDLSIDRHPALKFVSKQPANAETPLALITDSFLTPNELFFVRHHFPVPDPEGGDVIKISSFSNPNNTTTLSVEDLREKFTPHSVVATLQCTGNRRTGFKQVKDAPGEVKGLPWGVGAISTAEWRGVRLCDVLRALVVEASPDFPSDEHASSLHVHFVGRDNDGAGQHYGISIPLARALDERSDVLLALEMNGAPIPLDHGAPVRLIVPGAAGCRSVKWLQSIEVSREESSAFWQKEDYKSFSPSQGWEGLDFDTAPAVMSTPVQSAITSVTLSDDKTYVIAQGYAFSGGGNRVIRVDVSSDGGRNWVNADLEAAEEPANSYRRTYSWVLWKAVLDVGDSSSPEFVVTAVDESYNSQPDSPRSIWNVRGILNNSWHRVSLS